MLKKTKPLNRKLFTQRFALLTSAAFVIVGVVALALSSAATNDGALSVTPGSGSFAVGSSVVLKVYEDSGTQSVNSFDLGLSYDAAKLDFTSVSTAGSPFAAGGCPESTGGSGKVSVVCFIAPYNNPSSVSGKQLIATVTFTAKAAGSTNVSFVKESAEKSGIFVAGTGENIWNQTTSGGTYTITTTTSGGGTGGTNGGGTSGGGTSGGTGGGGSSSGSTSSGTKQTTSNSGGTKQTSTGSGSNGVTSTTTNPANNPTPQATEGGQTVAVTILDSFGQPASGIEVKLGEATAISDINGVATFFNIAPGTYSISAKNKVLGAATKEITINQISPQAQLVNLQLAKKANYYMFIALGVLVALLIIAGNLFRRWLKAKRDNKRRFNGYVSAPSSTASSDSNSDNTPEPLNDAPTKIVPPKPEVDDSEELAVLSSVKPKIEKTDTLDEIERKVGAKKKVTPAPVDSNNFEPNLVKPSKSSPSPSK